MTEECIGREVCTSIAKSIEPMVDPKDCQTHFKCDENSNIDNHWERHGEARALSINSIKRIIQTKSIRRPKDWYRSKYCNKCIQNKWRGKCIHNFTKSCETVEACYKEYIASLGISLGNPFGVLCAGERLPSLSSA